METFTYLIIFEEASAADANRYAENLRNMLLDAIPDIQVERKRHDMTTQDAGQQLLIQLLASPAAGTMGGAMVGLLVTTITNWLQRHPHANLTIKRPQGDIIVNNVTDRTAVKLVKMHLQSEKEDEKS